MKPVGVGIIGYGGFGHFLHQSWRDMDDISVNVIADVRADRLTGLTGVRVVSDWKAILEASDVEIVAIVTEPSTHEEIATACMKAGKAILVEKPLAQDSSAASRIIKARDQYEAVAAIDLIMRFNPLLKELRQLTLEGVFGKLRRVDVENYAQDESLPAWFWDRSRSGGILVEHAVHFIDLVHFLQPAPVLSVNGLVHQRSTGEEDQVMANILYQDGLVTSHYHSFARPGFFEKTRIRLAYDLADIDLHGWIPLGGEFSVLVSPESIQRLRKCPFLHVGQMIPVREVNDESRPKGWGIDQASGSSQGMTIKAGGLPYEVTHLIEGRLDQGRNKPEVYATCVRESIRNVAAHCRDRSLPLEAPLEEGLLALQLGESAAQEGRKWMESMH